MVLRVLFADDKVCSDLSAALSEIERKREDRKRWAQAHVASLKDGMAGVINEEAGYRDQRELLD